MHYLKRIWSFLHYIYNRYHEDGVSHRSASLAYSTLLSLVPLMMIGFYILSFFPIFKGTGHTVQEFIVSNFVADSASAVTNALNSFMQSLNNLTWTNLISLLFVSALLVYNMVLSFNAIWRVELKYHYAISFTIYLFVLLLLPIIFGILILFASYLFSLSFFNRAGVTNIILKPASMIFPYIFAFFTFAFFNWVLPSCKVRIWPAIVAGFFTTIFFELAKYLFGLYLSYFPTYRLIYGALATIPLFLVWLYVCWIIILIGAEICHAISIEPRPY